MYIENNIIKFKLQNIYNTTNNYNTIFISNKNNYVYGIISKYKNTHQNYIEFFGLNSNIYCNYFQECKFVLNENFNEIIVINKLNISKSIKMCFSNGYKFLNCNNKKLFNFTTSNIIKHKFTNLYTNVIFFIFKI